MNSSPHMNNVILLGAMFMILSPISLSFDSDFPHSFDQPNSTNSTGVDSDAKDRYTAWCNVSYTTIQTISVPVVFVCSSTSSSRVVVFYCCVNLLSL